MLEIDKIALEQKAKQVDLLLTNNYWLEGLSIGCGVIAAFFIGLSFYFLVNNIELQKEHSKEANKLHEKIINLTSQREVLDGELKATKLELEALRKKTKTGAV